MNSGSLVTGFCASGDTITISGNNVVPNPTTGICNASGTFTIPVVLSGNTTTGTITITPTDPAGNQGSGLVISPIIIDTIPPVTPIVYIPSPINPLTTPLFGTGESGAVVTITDGSGNVLGTGIVNARGNFTVYVPSLTGSTV